MKQADLHMVGSIAEEAHPAFPEEAAIFAEKQRLFEPFCFTLECDGAIAGYCFSHPWRRDSVPPLNRLLGRSLPEPNCLFVHDVALAPEARGKGASAMLMELLCGAAQRHELDAITLVALYGSDKVWSRYGFNATEIEKNEIKSYGPSAVYMLKSLR